MYTLFRIGFSLISSARCVYVFGPLPVHHNLPFSPIKRRDSGKNLPYSLVRGFFFFFLTLKIFSKQDWPVDGLSLTYSPSCKVQAQLSLICQRGLTCISSSLHLPHLFCNALSHNQAVHTKLFCASSKGRPIFIFILLFFSSSLASPYSLCL